MKNAALDHTLLAIAELAPKDDPELKALPVGNIQVGSTVVVIWLPKAKFVVKKIYPEEQTADLEQLETGGAINADLCDLRNIEKETE